MPVGSFADTAYETCYDLQQSQQLPNYDNHNPRYKQQASHYESTISSIQKLDQLNSKEKEKFHMRESVRKSIRALKSNQYKAVPVPQSNQSQQSHRIIKTSQMRDHEPFNFVPMTDNEQQSLKRRLRPIKIQNSPNVSQIPKSDQLTIKKLQLKHHFNSD